MLVHPQKLRSLFWLRWKIFTRAFSRNPWQIFGAIMLVLFVVPLAGGMAFLTFFGYRFLPTPINEELLYLVLSGLLLLWILLPLLEFNTNEGLNLSKLNLFPLTRWELMLSLLFSTLLDIPTLALVLLLGAVVVGFGVFVSIPMTLFSLLVMLVFYVQIIAVSQLVLALLQRTLQSRRFRDISVIIIIVFSSLGGIGGQSLSRVFAAQASDGLLTNLRVSGYLQWVPSGIAARSVQMALHGAWLQAFGWLVVLVAVSLLFLYLWQMVIARSLASPEEGGTPVQRRRKRGVGASVLAGMNARTGSGLGLLDRLFSPDLLAITVKDFKYYRRDPQLAGIIIQSFFSAAILFIIPLVNGQSASSITYSPLILLFIPILPIFSMISLSLNSLGLDRLALTTLFLFPIPPQRILWGKNLAVFLLGTVELLLLILVGSLVSHSWEYSLPSLIAGMSGIFVALACGNFSSVFIPQRMRTMGRFQATGEASASSQGGCLRSVLIIGVLGLTLILLIPVALAIVLPLITQAPLYYVLSLPLALAYGIAFHQIVTRLVAPYVVTRTPEILAATSGDKS